LVVTLEHETDHGPAGKFGDNASNEVRVLRARALVGVVHAQRLELMTFGAKG
jgi:hypothetical protein